MTITNLTMLAVPPSLGQGPIAPVEVQLTIDQMEIISALIAQAVGTQASAQAAALAEAVTEETTTVNGLIATAIAGIGGSALRSYIAGLTTSWVSTTSFAVAAGMGISDDQTATMALASTLTKTTALWAVGTSLGGLDTGTIAASTWYHVYLIQRPDTKVVDVLFSTSPTAPTMPTNYTLKRRIGSTKTDASSHFLKWWQYGDIFIWDAPIGQDYNTNNLAVTTAVLVTLSVPTGLQLEHYGNVNITSPGSDTSYLIDDPETTDVLPTSTLNTVFIARNNNSAITLLTRTNASGQIRIRASVIGASITISTIGWRDRRGQDA